MRLLRKVSLRLFDKDRDGRLSESELRERDRVVALNSLPLEKFLALPSDDRAAAEDMWAARVIEANVRRRFGKDAVAPRV